MELIKEEPYIRFLDTMSEEDVLDTIIKLKNNGIKVELNFTNDPFYWFTGENEQVIGGTLIYSLPLEYNTNELQLAVKL